MSQSWLFFRRLLRHRGTPAVEVDGPRGRFSPPQEKERAQGLLAELRSLGKKKKNKHKERRGVLEGEIWLCLLSPCPSPLRTRSNLIPWSLLLHTGCYSAVPPSSRLPHRLSSFLRCHSLAQHPWTLLVQSSLPPSLPRCSPPRRLCIAADKEATHFWEEKESVVLGHQKSSA